jgi:hypothetical protein
MAVGGAKLTAPTRSFPFWFLRIICDRCGKDSMPVCAQLGLELVHAIEQHDDVLLTPRSTLRASYRVLAGVGIRHRGVKCFSASASCARRSDMVSVSRSAPASSSVRRCRAPASRARSWWVDGSGIGMMVALMVSQRRT